MTTISRPRRAANKTELAKVTISMSGNIVDMAKSRAVLSSLAGTEHAQSLSAYIEYLIEQDMKNRRFRKPTQRN